MTLEEAELDVLGSAEKIIISKEDTIIMGGAGEKADIDERLKYTDKEFPPDFSSLIKEENIPYAPEYVNVFR